MGRGGGPTRGRPPTGPPADNGLPYDMGPPGWGPPLPGGWGPPPPGGWPPLPDEWGPPPGGWGPRGPPPYWGARGPPPPGWGPHPDDWLPPPEDWGLHPDDWRPPHREWRTPHSEDWPPVHPDYWRRPHPNDWGPDRPFPPSGWGHPAWGPEGPPEPWGPEPGPPRPVPSVAPPGMPPPVGIPPPDPSAFGPVAVPPIPPSSVVPPFGFPAFPPPTWTGEAVVEEPMPNPPPDQPEWIKALISAPSTESALSETKKSLEEVDATKAPAADPVAVVKPKPNPKPESSKVSRALGLLGKRTFDKPPPGRSTGIISFIGPTFGYIEREDLEKFTFSFDAFFGNPKAMTPGVRVHFTACKEKNSQIATDVKVAAGGTENVDTDIYEAVVSQPLMEPQLGERQYPGQVHVTIGPLRTNLIFERKDSTVTLLKNDQVLVNLLTDIVSDKRRATNIKPKIPSTFSHTNELREKGVIMSLKDSEGVIRSDEHSDLPFDIKENFSDVEFTDEDINEEVEFTVIALKSGKRAIRICRAKEPLLLTLCTATAAAAAASVHPDTNSSSNGEDNSSSILARGKTKQEVPPNMMLDPELYEGIVSQPIIEPTDLLTGTHAHNQALSFLRKRCAGDGLLLKPTLPGYPGQIHANIGPVRTNVTFNHQDCGVTLLKNDHVLINLLIDRVTKKRRAANIKPKIPFTFSYTKETRDMGVITFVGPKEGILSSEKHGKLPFDVCENFSDSEFNSNDIDKDVEFTPTIEKGNKRAIRLRRIKRMEDKILEEQKKREEEEKRKKREEEERKEEDERKRQEEEKEAERKKKEEVAAALAAAKDKWTPLGFSLRDPHSLDDVSKERFEGTVLRAISKHPRKVIKKEPVEHRAGGAAQDAQVTIKVEEMNEDEAQETEVKCAKDGNEAGKLAVKEEEEELKKNQSAGAADVGRLVMTVDGEQKQLSFEPKDLLTTATMLDGDKVRFNIATHRETKEERATYVEILPASFEESIEQRRNGIVIEFSEDSGLIKCSQNPQLYFHMSEVIEKKKLELNEKVEFSVVPHETADGGHQAIRIKRYTESVFLPVRKLGGVGANKGKMTIKLAKPSEDTEKENPETDKLKAVVKNLRAQDNKTHMSRQDCNDTRRRYGRSSSKSRSRSKSNSRTRSPPRDQFGRVIKRRRSISSERERKSSRHKRSRSRERSHRRTRSRSRSRSRSKSRSSSRSRSKERRKDKPSKKGSQASRDRDEGLKRRRDLSPPSRRSGTMDDELARKKRELEELNEMIAYKKSLVEIDPRGLDPGQRTCIDYDHGRIAVPLTEYKPVRSILKKRPEAPEYRRHPSQSYDDHYYERPYSQYPDRRYSDHYGDPYTSRPYPDRTYSECAYESHHYGELPYGGPSSICRYTDRYDVYDQPYDDNHYESAYGDQPYNDPYRSVKQNHSHEPPSQSGQVLASTQPPLTHSAATLSSGAPFKPPSPTDSPPKSSSPKLKNMSPAEKPPLDRFLDMLNKKVDSEKKSETIQVNDDLLPHERALQDGRGFSRIVGLTREQPSGSQSLKEDSSQLSPKQSSLDGKSEEPKSTREPYDKIQSLLRTIGLKLSTGDVSKLAGPAHDKVNSPKSLSTERGTLSFEREELRTSRTGSVESDHIHSPSPVRSSSLEPLSRHKPVSHYEGFLDQQELKELKKAQQLQSFTKTMASVPSTTPSLKLLPGPPPAYYQHPHSSVNWPLGITSPISSAQGSPSSNMITSAPDLLLQRCVPPGHPPGPPPQCPGQSPPGPPPQRPIGQPSFTQSSSSPVLSFISQPPSASPANTIQLQSITTAAEPLPPPSSTATSGNASVDQMAISTTVARCLKVIETVKSLAVQSSAKPAKSVQFSLPTESPLDSSPQTITESDDDVKIKQNDKLDLFNRTVVEKREQQFEEMLANRKQGEKGTDGTRPSSGLSCPQFSPVHAMDGLQIFAVGSTSRQHQFQSLFHHKSSPRLAVYPGDQEKKPTAVPPPKRKFLSSGPKNVWICGHSLVYWAESRAKSPEVGMQLGMDPSKVAIWWKGTQGMAWSQLLFQLHQLKVTWPKPDVLIVHLGGNDLSTDSPTDLLASVKKDLTSIKSIFPQCVLVWSNILPRRVWRHSTDSHEVDLVRTTVNRRIQNVVSELGGTSLTHDNIRCGSNTGLYRADGVHLSPKGIDTFNLNLQDFLEKWEVEVNKAYEKD